MRITNPVVTVFLLASLAFSGCTKPGETTAISATTGGVVGAGMGAVVGAQTGDALAGAAIGAAMGALAGGAIGNALEAHEEVMQRQDEALERQQRIISSQQSEIQELRRIGQDSISFRAPGEPAPQRQVEERATLVVPQRLTQTETTSSNNVWRQKEPTPVLKEPATVIKSVGNVTTVTTPAALQPNLTPAQSADCLKADEEISKAEAQQDVADKLFHYRRALRLCPTNPGHHNKIGELYVSLNRKDDARYEFGEALRLDPSNSVAKANMSKLGR